MTLRDRAQIEAALTGRVLDDMWLAGCRSDYDAMRALLVAALDPPTERPDVIVTAFHAGISASIRRIHRAIHNTERQPVLPLNADECCTILEHTDWHNELPVTGRVPTGTTEAT